MKLKTLITLMSAVCLVICASACDKNEESKTANAPKVKEPFSAITAIKADNENSESVISRKFKSFEKTIENKGAQYKIKAFKIGDNMVYINLEKGWELKSGGVATDNQSDLINPPGVIQYLDTDTTISINVQQECEEKDAFLSNTEKSYLEAYGSEFDSIDITSFKQISVCKYDSFEIKADVTVNGKSYKMTNIISNDVGGKVYSWRLLDADGSQSGLNLAEKINYSVLIDAEFRTRRIRDRDFDDLYKVTTPN